MYALCLIRKERHYQLPSTPTRGHGVILLLFFTLNFITQNVTFFNLNASDWFFQMKTKSDNIEMSLFITRYICTMLCFVLGFKAPGIQAIENEDETVLINDNSLNNVSSIIF